MFGLASWQLALAIAAAATGLLVVLLGIRMLLVIRRYAPHIERVFDERPVFAPTAPAQVPEVPEFEFQNARGLTLRGSFLSADGAGPRGLVLFCHEFMADRWSGMPYWDPLRQRGFEVFAFDFANHGRSDSDPAYTPRHWVTWREVEDVVAAIGFVRSQQRLTGVPIGLFGVSRGGGAAICAAARANDVRCIVTDGAFPTHGTMTNYMRKWVTLYAGERRYFEWLPDWYYGFIRDRALHRIARRVGCGFPRIERSIRRIGPRPILMIHGGRDSYIRPDIARELFENARQPRELWVVHGAKHNACVEVARDEYARRVGEFFERHLARVA